MELHTQLANCYLGCMLRQKVVSAEMLPPLVVLMCPSLVKGKLFIREPSIAQTCHSNLADHERCTFPGFR